MQISPPFGYKEVVPFLKTQKVRLLAPGEVPEFAQHGNAMPISLSEFQPVARDYPIVFTAADGSQSFAPVAVLGLTSGENL
ncbi:MAG: SapC family protein, partial [Betaproteobacteria bacterium]